MQSGKGPSAGGKREISQQKDPGQSIGGVPERTRQIKHADKQKEHQPEQGGGQPFELPHRQTGSRREQRASDKIHPEQVPRHPAPDHILNKLRAAEMLGREYSERNGDEDRAQGDELVPAAGRADLFSNYKNSDDKID